MIGKSKEKTMKFVENRIFGKHEEIILSHFAALLPLEADAIFNGERFKRTFARRRLKLMIIDQPPIMLSDLSQISVSGSQSELESPNHAISFKIENNNNEEGFKKAATNFTNASKKGRKKSLKMVKNNQVNSLGSIDVGICTKTNDNNRKHETISPSVFGDYRKEKSLKHLKSIIIEENT